MVRAKFYIQSKLEIVGAPNYGRAWKVEMIPVWEGPDGDGNNIASENHIFSKATPSGKLEMLLTDPAAADKFRAGECQYVDFSPAGLPAYAIPPAPTAPA